MKKLFASLAALAFGLALALPAAAQVPCAGCRANMLPIVTSATTTGNKAAVRSVNTNKTYQFTGSTTAGTGTAVLSIEGSNAQASWNTVGTSTLTLGTVTTSSGFDSGDRWTWLRAVVTTISGTGASVSITAGY
jgi:hypothetical protein